MPSGLRWYAKLLAPTWLGRVFRLGRNWVIGFWWITSIVAEMRAVPAMAGFMTDETFARELGGVSKRQAQRIRTELLANGWICFPNCNAGGRGNSTIWYHLHPDGRPCPHATETR